MYKKNPLTVHIYKVQNASIHTPAQSAGAVEYTDCIYVDK